MVFEIQSSQNYIGGYDAPIKFKMYYSPNLLVNCVHRISKCQTMATKRFPTEFHLLIQSTLM